jgi:hypothetical protein
MERYFLSDLIGIRMVAKWRRIGASVAESQRHRPAWQCRKRGGTSLENQQGIIVGCEQIAAER